MSLTTLPILPLEKIASYLDFASLVSLAASSSFLAHLHPKEQLVKGEDFSVYGYNPDKYVDQYCSYFIQNDFYFDGCVLHSLFQAGNLSGGQCA